MRPRLVLITAVAASVLAGCARIPGMTSRQASAATSTVGGAHPSSGAASVAAQNPVPQTAIIWTSCMAQHPNAATCGAPPFPSQGWDFTNYLVYPMNTVIAGAPSASPSNGVFILTDGPAAGIHYLPDGSGVPTITKWDPPDTVHFTTTTGDSGTLNVSSGRITILPASAPFTVSARSPSAP